MLLRFPFDLAHLVRVGSSFKVRSLSSSSRLFELATGSLGVQRLLPIDGMHWTWACWLWHFQTAHFPSSDSVPRQWASLPSSQKPGNETGHSEQVTASQGIGANQAKHAGCRQPRSQGGAHPICSSLKEWSTPAPHPGSVKPSCT